MKEARIILASDQRNGEPVDSKIRGQLADLLARKFGGYTEIRGHGGFIMADGLLKQEFVTIYDVAMESEHYPALTGIAQWLCRVANQECVYVRDVDGIVRFYDRGN